MFLHIGSQIVISIDSIEAILNIKTIGVSGITREFLNKKKKNIRRIDKNPPKSIILTSKKDIIFSPIQISTLKKRFKKGYFYGPK
ncbi:TPA: DUF370 domain-containing protein [bacterium]|nr:DUF370 domain-containing protein [bacterium]